MPAGHKVSKESKLGHASNESNFCKVLLKSEPVTPIGFHASLQAFKGRKGPSIANAFHRSR